MNEPHEPHGAVDVPSTPADSLDAGLAAAFGRPATGPPSVLSRLRNNLGDLRPPLLKEALGESAHVVKPMSDTMPPPEQTGDRYQLQGEIARGGMGAVLRGWDVDLGRDLAVKVLLEKYVDRPEVAQRFIEEAQIAGQLQHPGVVPVYDIGRFGTRPFFTMKLVKGKTLAHLLAERADYSQDRPRYLGIALQVAQTLAYTHAKGVIHRDLKPANIMVGAFGEVQVMDWGLAKVLAEGGVADEEKARRAHQVPEDVTTIRTARSTGSAAGTDTEAGSLLGTPAYMPPEQANGDIVHLDRRADVFGLGAILCEILTGKPPYVGRSSEEVRRKAANGDVADATARLDACGADPELIALTKGCLAAKAIDRPKDGQEVADGLSSYLNGVQERLHAAERERAVSVAREAEQRKRRRTVQVAGGVIAVVLLAGLSVSLWQMFRAIEAEGQANQNLIAEQLARANETKARQQAFAALRSMTADVVERKFAQGTVLTEDDRAFLRGVIAQYDAFAAIKGDDADSRRVRAEGRHRVGLLRYTLGELQEAEQDYDQALSIYKQLAADFPSRPDFRHDLAKHHNSRGNLLAATGRLNEAEQDFDQALSILKQLAADFPSRPNFRRELAKSHNNRGNLLMTTGRLNEAEQDYDQALSILKQLAADLPSRPDFRQELAGTHNNRGILLYTTDRLQEAEQDYDQALSIRKQLAADFPSRPDFRHDLAKSHGNRGILLKGTGRLKEAEQDYDQALSILKQLAADFPTRPEFRHDLAKSHNNRGPLLSATGRLKEAEQDYDQALSIYKQLAADFPNQPDLRNELADICVNLGLLHLQQGNWPAAKRLLLEGRPHHLASLKANPRHPDYRGRYRNHLSALTQLHAGLLEQEDALRTAETCRDLGWDAPADAYDAACFLSLCVPIVAQHAKLDDKQRQEAAQFYGDAAMKLLHDAVSKGYQDVAHMKKDTDLDPLRQREDFKKLLAELEAKSGAKATPKD